MFNIALYQPDIPQNTAAIIRLCYCFNTTLEIIEPCGFHLDDIRLKKVAMDYLDESKIVTYKSYKNFRVQDVVTINKTGSMNLLELFHGPTLAFKDIAMQVIGNMYESILEKNKLKSMWL